MPTIPYMLKYDPDLVSPELIPYMSAYVPGRTYRWKGATTIGGLAKDAAGIIWKANQLGLEGINTKDEWGDKMDSGTLAHALAESHITGINHPIESEWKPEVWKQGMTGYKAFQKFLKGSDINIVQTELSLMSPEWLFGGTIDAISENDEISIIDYKTGKSIYQEALTQVCGAYKHLYELHHKKVTGGYHIIRFNKDDGSFAHHWWEDVPEAWELFKHLRIVSELQKQLQGRL
jgi:hypothetical protein